VVERAAEPAPALVEPEPVVPEPAPPPEPVDRIAEARERASVSGLLPLTRELAALRDSSLSESLRTAENLGGAADAAPEVTERALIASNVGGSSAGIDTSSLSRSTGGNGIGTRSTTAVASPVEGIGATGTGGEVTRTGQSELGSRSREEIERVFDQNKGAIYALYNRALRTNPTLEGKVVLQLTITPAGTVSACEIVSSELGDPDLEQKLVQRVLLFQFEAKDVETVRQGWRCTRRTSALRRAFARPSEGKTRIGTAFCRMVRTGFILEMFRSRYRHAVCVVQARRIPPETTNRERRTILSRWRVKRISLARRTTW
jgi:TonB family protein